MLVDEIKKQMFAAMKANQTTEKEILRVAVGELQTVQSRSETPLSDEDALSVLRKLVKSNEESLASTTSDSERAVLLREIEVLRTFLPTSLTLDQIKAALEPVLAAIRAASGDGSAVGVAMKQLKAVDARVDGKDVALAVKQLRS
ncbi:MAG: GatB/YqeY domain-containing protein [Polyangiaceae bacterium]|nr:GatB/YqeY domain-containing protein [Polyangiaceae bacterium]